MILKESIAMEDDYRNKVIDYYNSILNGRLMSFDLNKAKDSDLMPFISLYDENEPSFNNYCSWLEIGDIGKSNYNGNDFQFIKLLTKSGGSIEINFSQFKYEMSSNLGHEGFPVFDKERAVHVCTIDGKKIDPYVFFCSKKGSRLLYLYSYPTVTSFNSIKTCYKFAYENISVSHLRNYIHNVQMTVLQDCILYPDKDTPYGSIRIEVEGAMNSRPLFQHHVKCKILNDFAINIFESEFKETFMRKFNEIKIQD